MAPAAGVSRTPGPFKKDDRVRKRPEYLSIYKCCAPMHTSHLVFYARRGPSTRRRLGCTVPKKVGIAVRRNQIKRWIREAFRAWREELPEGCVMVVNAKRSAAGIGYGDVASAFAKIAERLKREGLSL